MISPPAKRYPTWSEIGIAAPRQPPWSAGVCKQSWQAADIQLGVHAATQLSQTGGQGWAKLKSDKKNSNVIKTSVIDILFMLLDYEGFNIYPKGAFYPDKIVPRVHFILVSH